MLPLTLLKTTRTLLSRYRFYLLLLLLTLPALKDLLLPGYFPMHDDLQIFRLHQLHKCVLDLQLPCRWVPDAGFGLGYPLFSFYPPFPYYPAELLHLLGVNLFWSIKIMFILAFVLSGVFMFMLARELFGSLAALVAAVFYIYAPYHSVDIYVRGALNEAWGMVWFPLIFLFSYQLISQKTNHSYPRFLVPKLALAYAALLLSHNVMTLIFTPLLGLWVFFWLFFTRHWSRLKDLSLSGLWAVGLAAFFFLPVTLESRLVHVESMTVGYFNYLAHFASVGQLFFSRFWGYGGSTYGPEDDMAFPLGHLHWGVGVLVGLLSLYFLIKKVFLTKNKKNFLPTSSYLLPIILLLPTGFYVFLTHFRSVWFWDHLPLLYYAQFPWRLLAIPTFTLSFLAGSLIPLLRIKNPVLCSLFSVLLITSVIIWNLPFFRTDKQLVMTREEKLSGKLWNLQVTGGIFDYLPKSASRPPGDPGVYYPELIEGQGGVTNFRHGTNWLKFNLLVNSSSSLVRLPIFDYPNWKVKLDGQVIPHSHESDLGRIEVSVPQGDHRLEARLHDTPLRTLSNYLTLISLLAIPIYLKKTLSNQAVSSAKI